MSIVACTCRDGASIVADVWLSGQHLGRHHGAFTAFRFDVTDKLVPGNVLLVKVDNSAPVRGDDPTAVAPLGGDFNMVGGPDRGASLVETPARRRRGRPDPARRTLAAPTSLP
nr:hypothetical protein [Massilia sp. PDC64]